MTQPEVTPHEAMFVRDGALFMPTGIGTSPWTGNTIGGVPLAALSVHVLDAVPTLAPMVPARITMDILGAVPMAPLEAETRIVRDGKRVQLLEAELRSGGRTWARTTMLRVREDETPASPLKPAPEFPSESIPTVTELAETVRLSSPTDGTGRGAWWIRLRPDAIAGTPLAPLERAAMIADFGSGISAVLPTKEWTLANVDLSIHFMRRPRGEWLLLEAKSESAGNGIGIARGRLSDQEGAFGHCVQTTFLARR